MSRKYWRKDGRYKLFYRIWWNLKYYLKEIFINQPTILIPIALLLGGPILFVMSAHASDENTSLTLMFLGLSSVIIGLAIMMLMLSAQRSRSHRRNISSRRRLRKDKYDDQYGLFGGKDPLKNPPDTKERPKSRGSLDDDPDEIKKRLG